MQVLSFSEVRKSFKAVLDRVTADADVTVITRRHGQSTVVMSLDTYNAHLETSLDQARRGELLEHGLIDPDA